jgi:D-3-phosphoglycerate dehydrogenase
VPYPPRGIHFLEEAEGAFDHRRIIRFVDASQGFSGQGRRKGAPGLPSTPPAAIIDEKALYDELKASRIAGAALDVFDQEPTPQDNPLLTLPNFIAAPHVAGVTREAVDRMGVAAVENILREALD